MYDEGLCVPQCVSEEGDLYEMSFSKCKIRRPLGSVHSMIHKNKKVVFDLDDGTMDANGVLSVGSYIEDKATGRRTKMREKDGSFVIKMKVMPYRRSEFGASQLAPLAQAPPLLASTAATTTISAPTAATDEFVPTKQSKQ